MSYVQDKNTAKLFPIKDSIYCWEGNIKKIIPTMLNHTDSVKWATKRFLPSIYLNLLCKCRIDFICRIYRSCLDGINTLLEFCIKQAVEAFGELKQDMLPLLHPPPMSLSFCPYYKHLILFSHFDFVMLYHFFNNIYKIK